VLGAAAIMNVVGHFVGGEVAGMPMSIVLQYGVPLLMVPVLMAFKYGKPRGYVRDLACWYTKPHAYCAGTRPRNPVGVSEGELAVPLTLEQHERKLHDPAMCEQLPVRDYLDNVVVRTNGAFVAGYELKGLASYFASDEGRDRGKLMLEALLRSLPEQSMRVQFRYEVVEDLGDLLEQYGEAQQSERAEVIALDELLVDRWRTKEASGHYMRPLLHVYFIWDPVVFRRIAGKPLKPTGNVFSVSARKCIERGAREHQQLLAEFESLLRGLDQFLQDGVNRRTDMYGGPIENRSRFLLQVLEALVSVWGGNRVAVRIAPGGGWNGMSDSDPDALFDYVANELNQFGLAYLHIIEPRVRGNVVVAEGQYAIAAARLRKIFKGKIIAAGGFEPDTAEEVVEKGDADLVAFGRHFVANPDLPKRIRLGLPLNAYDRNTFYTFDARGYTDYPFYEQTPESVTSAV